ncbi:MAG: hypothetical protein AAB225_12485, partial [Acidobacteriota bacterium]
PTQTSHPPDAGQAVNQLPGGVGIGELRFGAGVGATVSGSALAVWAETNVVLADEFRDGNGRRAG